MNPNLNYAQVVRGPGQQEGDREGVLDLEVISKIVGGVEVMRRSGSKEWEQETDEGVVRWAGEMVEWLVTAGQALGERDATKCSEWELHSHSLCPFISDFTTSTILTPDPIPP